MKILERNYCVYMHKNKINGKVYIGITGQKPELRWNNGKGYNYNTHFYYAIQKYGWDNFEHIILIDNLTKKEAELAEIKLIQEYDSTNSEKGYNIQRGGNLNHSKYVYQYDRVTGKFIKKWDSVIQIEKELGIANTNISAVCLGKYKTINNFYFSYVYYGTQIPDEIYDWINTNECIVKVAQYDKDGKFIKIHNSIAEASRTVRKKNNKTNINFNNKLSFGYIWKKVESNEEDYKKDLSNDELQKYIHIDKVSKECYQYDLAGNFLCSYKSTTEAAKKIGKLRSQSSIASCCREETKTCFNCYWRYSDNYEYGKPLPGEELEKSKIHGLAKGVYQYDKNGKCLSYYNSVTDAAIKYNTCTNNISLACSGKIKTSKGFIWRYNYHIFTEEELKQINTNDKKKKVIQYDMNNNYIQTFDSLADASRKTGARDSSIRNCCVEKYKSANNYKWKYA